MPDTTRPALSHISLGTNDLARAAAFYDAVLGALGLRRMMEHEAGVAWGHAWPEFWVGLPLDGRQANAGTGTHVCFSAPSREAVHAFHAAALAAGGVDDGAPGPRPHYAPQYYAAFALDPDGHKIEALFWDTEAGRAASG
jgi:catechol 2,3-dioxygenase-like lactoylglutathione lyase family enzyme